MTSRSRLAIIAILCVVAAGIASRQSFRANQFATRLASAERERSALAVQLANLEKSTLALSNRLDRANHAATMDRERLFELLKLRGEVGLLRQQRSEQQRAAATAVHANRATAIAPEM